MRILQGDWDDGIVLTDPNPLAILFTTEHGESIPNSQMALHVLPMVETIVGSRDKSFAADVHSFIDQLRGPVANAFGTQYEPVCLKRMQCADECFQVVWPRVDARCARSPVSPRQ